MSSIQEIESAIQQLTLTEVRELSGWIDENYPDAFDVQLENDLKEGRMDSLVRQALADQAAGRTRLL